jgi:hypothetical protein
MFQHVDTHHAIEMTIRIGSFTHFDIILNFTTVFARATAAVIASRRGSIPVVRASVQRLGHETGTAQIQYFCRPNQRTDRTTPIARAPYCQRPHPSDIVRPPTGGYIVVNIKIVALLFARLCSPGPWIVS